MGTIHAEYRCSYKGRNGTLVVADDALYFRAHAPHLVDTLLNPQYSIHLPWTEIQHVQSSATGLEVSTATHQDYIFAGLMHQQERAWALCMSLHTNALVGSGSSGERPASSTTTNQRSHSWRRRNSDPLVCTTTLDDAANDQSFNNNDPNSIQHHLSPLSDTPVPATSLELHSFAALSGKLALPPISCAYNGATGKLYAGSAAIYFYGRKLYFFWDKQEVLMTWDEIQTIQLVNNNSTNNTDGGVVSTGLQFGMKNGSTHRFMEMAAADTVRASLLCIIRQYNETVSPTSSRRRLVRRMNSDPMLKALSHANIAVETAAAPLSSEPTPLPLSTHPTLVNDKTPLNVNDDWKDVLLDKSFPSSVVSEHVLNCSLDQFYDLYLADDAKYSISNYLEQNGDSHVKPSSWTNVVETTTQTRSIHYTHPVNAPMAPPTADARKEQRYRRYGDLGLTLVTKTHVEGVPMADCFFVHDCIRVENCGAKQVAVFMQFDVTFIKSTMFKRIIARTTTSEVSAVLQGLAAFMTEALGDTSVNGQHQQQPLAPVVAIGQNSTVQSAMPSNIIVPLMVVVILMQVLMFVWKSSLLFGRTLRVMRRDERNHR
jgi:hypothetical protein